MAAAVVMMVVDDNSQVRYFTFFIRSLAHSLTHSNSVMHRYNGSH